MKLSELIYDNEIEFKNKFNNNPEIKLITSIADEISENTLFIFIKSIKFNIQEIIDYVFSKKPIAVICDEDMCIESASTYIIKVRDSRHISALLYSRFYEINYSKNKFIGVTGTNGKTTTATIIAKILMETKKNVGFIGTGKISINNKVISSASYTMTTPDPNLLYKSIKMMQEKNCDYIVLEVSSHSIYFKKIDAIPFDICLFTNLSPEHLDFHESLEDYYLTKRQLFKRTKIGIFNLDDPYSERAYHETECEKRSIGIIKRGTAYSTEIKMNGLSGSEYIYSQPGLIYKISTLLPGAYNIYNTMFAVYTANLLSISPNVIKSALKNIEYVEGRMEQFRTDINVIIDYAHTPNALYNFLKTLKTTLNPEQNLNLVFGCGGERDRNKRPLMAKIAEFYCDNIIVTNDNSRGEDEDLIIADILLGFSKNCKYKVVLDRKNAIQKAILTAHSGDVIAIVGKGHELYNIDKNGIHSFNERAIISEAMKRRIKDNEN